MDGENAIHRAPRRCSHAVAYEAPTVDVDGLAYRESLQVVRVEGGIANNVVPDRCAVVVNRRYVPEPFSTRDAGDVCPGAGADHIEV